MDDYEKKFHSEISQILEELYSNPDKKKFGDVRRKKIKTEKKYVDYLVQNNFVIIIGIPTFDGVYTLQLELKGIEVFEKYGGWLHYKEKVLDKESRIHNSRKLAIKYWWLPIVLSFIAIVISVIALIFM